MKIHADLTKEAIVESELLPWTASPSAGVDRRMLDRDGEEVARCTTVVRYLPGKKFSFHVHSGGEEFLVLDGIFSDEHGHYSKHFYVRNPIGSSHEPYTVNGCLLLVKLRQMPENAMDEPKSKTTDTDSWIKTQIGAEWLPYVPASWSIDVPEQEQGQGQRRALPESHNHFQLILYQNEISGEKLTMEWWVPNSTWLSPPEASTGEEVFVIGGDIEYEGKSYGIRSWFRFPGLGKNQHQRKWSTRTGCRIYHKLGLLAVQE